MEGARSYKGGIDNLKATELRLGLPGTEDAAESLMRGIKRSNDQDIVPVAKYVHLYAGYGSCYCVFKFFEA